MLDFIFNRLLGFLVDSLWIGAVSWLFLYILTKAIHRKWANFRYYLSLTTFFGFVLVLILSFFGGDSIYNLWLKPKVVVFVNHLENHQIGLGIVDRMRIFVLDNSYYLIWIWIFGLIILGANLFLQSRNILKFEESKQHGLQLKALKESLMDGLDIKKDIAVKLMKNVSHPFTIGYFRPIIYFPIEAISGFGYEELEMILMHELIHIKRKDYIINLLQLCIETIFFFNPFVWHMSAVIRNERESSCDYEVISRGYSKVDYAKTLEKSYELHYNLALGFGSRNILSRIKFLTMFPASNKNRGKKDKFIFAFLLLFFMTISLGFGIITKNALGPNLITKGTEVYPKFQIEDNGTIIFYPDEHRAWHIYKNGEQAFYKDGILKNDELEDNFEYQEIDKGDVIEILYFDKLLNKKHKGARTKDLEEWKALLHEIQTDYGQSDGDLSKETFNTSLRLTPFGGMYLFEKKVSENDMAKYRKKYPEAMALYRSIYSRNDKKFIRQMILELQKDGLVDADFDSVQVLFHGKRDGKLLLNRKVLSKNHSDKYLIYLKQINNGFIYEESIHYIK